MISKGLNFVPSTTEDDDPISRMFRRKKTTMPKPDESPAVESYISHCRSDILKLKPKPIRRCNLTLGEMEALRSLKQKDDIVIKPVDKGGVIVVWSRDLYLSEALHQLSTLHHYTPLPDSQLTTF